MLDREFGYSRPEDQLFPHFQQCYYGELPENSSIDCRYHEGHKCNLQRNDL